MARGHCLNTSIVLVTVHGLSGLFRAVSAFEPSLSRPLPTLSPSLIGHLASVDVKQHESNPTQAEFRSCVKVEVDVLGSPSRTVSVDGSVVLLNVLGRRLTY